MTLFDFVVIAILAASVGLGVWRGLVREVCSVAAWLGAFWIAKEFTPIVAAWLPASVTNAGLRLLVGFIGLMLASLLLFSLLTMLVVHLVKVAGLKASDRTLGAFFGLVRGVLIVVVLVLLGGMTSQPREAYWRDALLAPPLQAMAAWVTPWLPPDAARRVNFE